LDLQKSFLFLDLFGTISLKHPKKSGEGATLWETATLWKNATLWEIVTLLESGTLWGVTLWGQAL